MPNSKIKKTVKVVQESQVESDRKVKEVEGEVKKLKQNVRDTRELTWSRTKLRVRDLMTDIHTWSGKYRLLVC